MDNKIRVMLVHDHAVMREGLSVLLQSQSDMEIVDEAADGLEAVTLARSLCPEVILMDVNMPNMNGLEATEIIFSEPSKTCIIGLSINDDTATVSSMQAAGAADYLTKDCNSSTLLSAIRNCDTKK